MLLDLKMAWRNIWRNPRRSLLTMSAIAFAAMFLVVMLSWQFGSYAAMINSSVKLRTGHLQVQESGYLEDREMRDAIKDPDRVAAAMASVSQITAHSLRANAFGLASSADRTYGAMVTGIQPEREARVSTIADLVRDGRYLLPSDTDAALVGRLLAVNLKIGVGDEVTLLGQGYDGSVAATVLTVRGIFSTGIDELDRNTIFMPLGYFQTVYAMGDRVHEAVAVCGALGDVPRAEAALKQKIRSGKLVVLDWKQLMPGLVQAIRMDLVSGLIFWVILVLVVAFSILNTFLMAIFERTREFGVMLALGTTPGRLMRLILFESFGMTAMGVIAGTAAGILITLYLARVGIDISGASEILSHYGISGRIHPRLTGASALIGPALVLAITLLIALYPAVRVRRMTPVAAMAH